MYLYFHHPLLARLFQHARDVGARGSYLPGDLLLREVLDVVELRHLGEQELIFG
jgi:hypothetical protein